VIPFLAEREVSIFMYILIHTYRGSFLTSPLGMNLAPRSKICPLGGMFTPLFTPGGGALYCLEEWRGEQIISPPGDYFTPREQNSPLGNNFAHGDIVCP
jgi:hypothetical protein